MPVIRLQSKESAEEFLKKDQTFVIGLFKNFEVREMLDVNKCVIFMFCSAPNAKTCGIKFMDLFNFSYQCPSFVRDQNMKNL